MAIFLYVIGALFAVLTFFVTTPMVAGLAAAFYLSNPLMSKALSDQGFTWYVYFASALFAFGVYLFSQADNYLMLAAVACFAGALFTMFSSKLAFFGGFFHRNYDQVFGITHPLILVPIFFYLALNLK